MIVLRSYLAEDRDALYTIALATGDRGEDASALYADPALMGHIYVGPYAAVASDLVIVAVDEIGVCGSVLGTIDTAAFEERLEQDWWPALRRRYACPDAVSRPGWSADQRRAFMIHHPERSPAAVTRSFPAHLHLNVLPRRQGCGLGALLFEAWRDLAAGRGAVALHVGVNRANPRAVQFWERCGFHRLAPDGEAANRTLWMGRPPPS